MVITALRPQQGSTREGKSFLPFYPHPSATLCPLPTYLLLSFSVSVLLLLSFLSPYFVWEKNPFQKLPKDLPNYFSLTRTSLYAHLQTNH